MQKKKNTNVAKGVGVATTVAAKANKTTAAKAGKKEETSHYAVQNNQHFLKDTLVKVIVLLISAVVVRLVPIPNVDAHKFVGVSFLSQYFSGELDRVAFVTQMLLAAVASVFFDFAVVTYHVTNPPHPKFVLTISRKICIYTHLTSGIVEIFSGVAAFVISDQDLQQKAAVLMSLASITHALTAYYQTTVVFGAKGVMVPGYLYAITIHITNAYRLFHHPTSLLFLLTTFLMLHIYVWCRFFIFFFRMFHAFDGYHYTVAIMMSGALLFPYAMGPLGNYNFLFICVVYCVLEYFFSEKTGKDLSDKLFAEHERYALIKAEDSAKWKTALARASGVDSNEEMARSVFDQYDTDKSGKLGVNEVANLITALGMSEMTTAKMVESADVSRDGSIAFDEFYRYVWNFASVKDRLVKLPKEAQAPMSEREQSKLVFDMLDIDKSGFIEAVELEMLLTQWGLPDGEASGYLAKLATNKREIEFDTFYKKLSPVWKFGVAYVFDA